LVNKDFVASELDADYVKRRLRLAIRQCGPAVPHPRSTATYAKLFQ